MSTPTASFPPAPEPEVPEPSPDEMASTPVTKRLRIRITGIDFARGLAMFGMFAAHVGPASDDGTVLGAIMMAAHGRSSILFATLAGISLAFMSGGSSIQTGGDGRRSALRIATRALIILILGTALTAIGTPVAVILAYYGIFFLFTIPFLRLRARTLLITAAVLAVISPITSFAIQEWRAATDAIGMFERVDPIAKISGDGIVQLILTGTYPAWTWMPFLLTGLALGRIGIAGLRKRVLAVVGLALMAVGYLGSFAALHLIPGALEANTGELTTKSIEILEATGTMLKPWPFLLGADEHSGTPFEIIGGIGTALVVIAVSLWLTTRFPRATWPIAAVGTMSLTVYTAHVIAINLLGLTATPGSALWVLLAFIAASMAFAVLWLIKFRRGPLENFMHVAVTKAPWVR